MPGPTPQRWRFYERFHDRLDLTPDCTTHLRWIWSQISRQISRQIFYQISGRILRDIQKGKNGEFSARRPIFPGGGGSPLYSGSSPHDDFRTPHLRPHRLIFSSFFRPFFLTSFLMTWRHFWSPGPPKMDSKSHQNSICVPCLFAPIFHWFLNDLLTLRTLKMLLPSRRNANFSKIDVFH